MAPLQSSPGTNAGKQLVKSLATATVNPPQLVQRQDAPTATVTVFADSGNGTRTGLTGGAIAGIVIGSVVGVLLLIWIIRSCFNLGAPPQEREKWYRDPPRHRHRSRSTRRRSSISVPPPVIIQDSRSRSRRHASPSYVYATEADRGRRGSHHGY
ncbi:hypothetical protein B0J13DRAFT_561903 [Dactylonectria estremocensis]|uniref:Uncharacterized protein n=1 Tax=Dactylonectria estremocensis TaxID=1079267 RepID=A0A9P9E697_9HYPO|nr:hypothetical protein B0J13DRAFT_561903 [Dactylonectria estremocensis]